jgi:hypothetical protein
MNTFTDRELGTVLAALRTWQRHHARQMFTSDTRLPEDDIATVGRTLHPLTVEEIDALCERLNTPSTAPVIAIALDGGVVQSVVSDDPRLQGIDVLVIDYDAEGATELYQVRQTGAGHAADDKAYAALSDHAIGAADGIALAETWEQFCKHGPLPVAEGA